MACRSVVIVWPAIVTVTVVPGAASEVPAIVGVGSFVAAVAPPVIATSGDTVSTVSVCVKPARLPAASETDMTTRCGPSERAAAVTDQAPPAWTGAVSVSSARFTVTVVPGATSAVPEMSGVASLVSAFAPPVIVTAGAAVSTVSCWLSVPSLPAGSVTEAVTVRVPSVSAVGVTFHVPPDCTSAVRVCASTVTRMIVPARRRWCRRSSGSGRSSSRTVRRRS